MAERVRILTQDWGVFLDRYGNARPGRAATLTHRDSTPVTVYTTETGGVEQADLVSNSLGQLPGWVEEDSYLLTVDGTVFEVEATRSDNTTRRDRLRPNVQDHPDVDPTGVAEQSTVFTEKQAEDATRPLYIPTGEYLISTRPFPTNAPVKVQGDGPGNTIINIDGVSLASLAGSRGAQYTITASMAVGDNTITLADTTGLTPDSFLEIVDSNQAFGGTSGAPSAYVVGEIQRILTVDSSTQITLEGRIEQAMPLVSANLSLKPLNLVSDIEFRDLTIRNPHPGDQVASGAVRALIFAFAYKVRVHNVHFEGLDATAIRLDTVIDFRITDCEFQDFNNTGNDLTNRTPYGVQAANGTCHGLVHGCRQRAGRHLFTTTADDGRPGPAWIDIIDCHGSGNKQAESEPTFDTHPQGRHIRFINCSAPGLASTAAFQSRAPYSEWINCKSVGGNYGLYIGGTGLRTIVRGGSFRDVDTGIFVGAEDVRILGEPVIKANVYGIHVTGLTDQPALGNPAITTVHIGPVELIGDPTSGGIVLDPSNAGLVVEPPHAPECSKPIVNGGVYTGRGRASRSNGQKGGVAPSSTGLWSPATLTLPGTAKTYYLRYVPDRPQRIVQIRFAFIAAASDDDHIDIGIYNAALTNKIGETGDVAGWLNGDNATIGNVTGPDLDDPVYLQSHVVYYVAFGVAAAGGTGAQIGGIAYAGALAKAFGNTIGNIDCGASSSGTPLPSSDTPSNNSTGPLLILAEG